MYTWKAHKGRVLGYTYENMQTDLAIFAEIFSEYVQVQSLGMSADFRSIDCLRIGKQNAQEKVFIFGGNSRKRIYDQSVNYGTGCKISFASEAE